MTQQVNPVTGRDETADEGLRPGEIVQGKYLVQRIIGVGGMCVVAAATNIDLEQVVALKVLRRSLAQNNEMVVRFMREARSAARLRSEHVGRVFDVSVLDTGEPFMVMEYLEGRDLGVVLDSRGAIPLAEAVEYILQATEAIGEAHSLGIVHRDLKPENLFLTTRADGEPHIKVIDFGIAKAIQPSDSGLGLVALTQDNTTFGTPTYMSPEQLREAKDVDARSDIFSLGVMLYELTTGRVPFEGSSTAELHAAILMEEPTAVHELDTTIPPEFDVLVAKCLAKDRFERFQNVAELARALVPFAPPRAKQYSDRVSRIISARPPAITIDNIDPALSPTSDRPSITGRHRRVRGSPIRVTPSDPMRLANLGSGQHKTLDAGDLLDARDRVPTLAPPATERPSMIGRWKLPIIGICTVLVALAFVGVFLLGTRTDRTAPAASVEPGLTASSPRTSAPSVPSASASAAPESASAAPSAVASTPANPGAKQPARLAGGGAPSTTAAPPAKKPPSGKSDEFDPYGTRK